MSCYNFNLIACIYINIVELLPFCIQLFFIEVTSIFIIVSMYKPELKRHDVIYCLFLLEVYIVNEQLCHVKLNKAFGSIYYLIYNILFTTFSSTMNVICFVVWHISSRHRTFDCIKFSDRCIFFCFVIKMIMSTRFLMQFSKKCPFCNCSLTESDKKAVQEAGFITEKWEALVLVGWKSLSWCTIQIVSRDLYQAARLCFCWFLLCSQIV